MELMSKKRWAQMSNNQQVDHLLDHELEYRHKFMQGRPQHQALIGGVIMSGWYSKKQDCSQEALENIANYVQNINYLMN